MSKKEELMDTIYKKAKALENKPTLVLSEGWDERGIKASDYIVKEGIAKMILLDVDGQVEKAAKEFNIDTSQFEVIDIKTSPLREELAEAIFKKREKKGMTKEKAMELLNDENYFGCAMCLINKADAHVGSLIRSTAELMKPSLQLLRSGQVNEVCVLYDPKGDRIIFGTDCSLNVSPDADQLAQMGVNTGNVAKMLGYDPVVGFMSFSTKGSGGETPEVLFVREAMEKAKKLAPDMNIGGEYQFDAAVNPYAAGRKCPDDPYAGKVNCTIFPNLTAANIFVHGLGQFSDMSILFSVIMGMASPVAILGRSTPLESVKGMFTFTALEAAEKM